jgi:hypothetical protein
MNDYDLPLGIGPAAPESYQLNKGILPAPIGTLSLEYDYLLGAPSYSNASYLGPMAATNSVTFVEASKTVNLTSPLLNSGGLLGLIPSSSSTPSSTPISNMPAPTASGTISPVTYSTPPSTNALYGSTIVQPTDSQVSSVPLASIPEGATSSFIPSASYTNPITGSAPPSTTATNITLPTDNGQTITTTSQAPPSTTSASINPPTASPSASFQASLNSILSGISTSGWVIIAGIIGLLLWHYMKKKGMSK